MPDQDGRPLEPEARDSQDPIAENLAALRHEIDAGKATADEIIRATQERAKRFDRAPRSDRGE